MRWQKTVGAWVLSAAVASSLVLTPAPARAMDRDEAPFMIMAGVFAVTMIVLAVNSGVDENTDKGTGTTATSEGAAKLTRAPVRRSQRNVVLGYTLHF
jgi:4-hydroxybenzoate polyprenyltransferase